MEELIKEWENKAAEFEAACHNEMALPFFKLTYEIKANVYRDCIYGLQLAKAKADSTSEKDLRVCEVIASASESFGELSQSERYNLTDETISKFKNGKMLYRKSALFNRSVQMLVRGVTVYDLIENIIQVTEDTTRSFEQYINRDDRPLTMR